MGPGGIRRVGCWLLLGAAALRAAPPATAQQDSGAAKPEPVATALAARTEGVKPPGQHQQADAPADIPCSVMEWNAGGAKPVLSLVCPPEEVFAPLRVYFKISWARPEHIPANHLEILAPPKAEARMHWTRTEFHVRLPVLEKNQKKRVAQWISFNELVGFYVQGTEQE